MGFGSPLKLIMQKIKVQYTGKEGFMCEFNGVKYFFSKDNPIKIVPFEVFQYMMNDKNPFKNEICPYRDDSVEEQEIKKETIEDDIKRIESEICEPEVCSAEENIEDAITEVEESIPDNVVIKKRRGRKKKG